MRVTDRLVFDHASRNTARAREAAQAASDVAATGQRFVHPGEDPTAAGRVAGLRVAADRFDAIGKAASSASDELGAADAALGSVATALTRARELAMQFSNGTYSAAQAAGAASEVRGLREGVLSSLDLQVGNRYLFSGAQDATAPFDAAGAYHGDAAVRQVEVAPGVLEDASVPFGTQGAALLKVLADLETALSSNAPASVRGTLAGLDAGIADVGTARAQAGVGQSAFDASVTASRAAADDARAAKGKLTDADVIASSIDLQRTQTALQASLAATAQSFRLSLVDFLK